MINQISYLIVGVEGGAEHDHDGEDDEHGGQGEEQQEGVGRLGLHPRVFCV